MMRITISDLIAPLLGVVLLTACSEPLDDAGQIARAIDAMQEGIEARRTGPVMEHLAEDFRAGGDLQRREIHGLMLYHFRRYPNIEVVTTGQDIRVEGEQADVTLNALLLGGETLFPERGRRYSVSMRWQKSEANWYLTRIRWQAAGEH